MHQHQLSILSHAKNWYKSKNGIAFSSNLILHQSIERENRRKFKLGLGDFDLSLDVFDLSSGDFEE